MTENYCWDKQSEQDSESPDLTATFDYDSDFSFCSMSKEKITNSSQTANHFSRSMLPHVSYSMSFPKKEKDDRRCTSATSYVESKFLNAGGYFKTPITNRRRFVMSPIRSHSCMQNTRDDIDSKMWDTPRAKFARQSRRAYRCMQPRKENMDLEPGLPKKDYSQLSERKTIDEDHITGKDVLLGRNKKSVSHSGNRSFRDEIAKKIKLYENSTKVGKTAIAHKIVVDIHKNGGRFLSPLSPDNCAWVEATNIKARKKTSQALRDGCARHRSLNK